LPFTLKDSFDVTGGRAAGAAAPAAASCAVETAGTATAVADAAPIFNRLRREILMSLSFSM
jgi:hypothetical protein